MLNFSLDKRKYYVRTTNSGRVPVGFQSVPVGSCSAEVAAEGFIGGLNYEMKKREKKA